MAEFHYAADYLVRILSQLTQDVERFDSMITSKRHLLQQGSADKGALDDGLVRRESKRIRAGADEMVTRALGALEELHSLTYAGVPSSN